MSLIDGDRLLEDLMTLRSFGASGSGVVRQMYSDVDIEAREWLAGRMTDAGLDAAIDGVGTVYGRSGNDGPAIVLGSHTDTQPEGGWLDGAMGVIHGLEVARVLAAHPDTRHLAVDVASWADEEGTYASFTGSRSFVGELTEADLDAADRSGERLGDALIRCGLHDRPRVRLETDRHVAYLESHIEQGPRLDDAGLRIGVVHGIVGIRSMRLEFAGRQNHAGTTPMDRRSDAAAAMFRFGVRFDERMRVAAGPLSVWTIGRVDVEPGAESIVPGRAAITIQFRDTDAMVLDRMQTAVHDLVREFDGDRGVAVRELRTANGVAPAPMHPDVVSRVEAAAEQVVPGGWMSMPSAAGHDAQVMAPHLPSGMVFIPSIGGVSHDFAEDSDPADIVLGAEVLAAATIGVLTALG